MRARLVSSVLVAAAPCLLIACGFSVTGGATPSDDEPPRDAAPDAIDAATDGATPDDDATVPCNSFSTLLATCAAETAMDLDVPAGQTYTFDTSTGTLASPNVDIPVVTAVVVLNGSLIESSVLFVGSLTVSGTLRAIGPRPLVIVANDAVSLSSDGLIDVSAGGAGARATCPGMAMPGMTDTGGGAGGGGAGFGGAGSNGGNGDSDGGQSTGGPAGGSVALPAFLIGGCPGGTGGDGDTAMTGGRGGPGGGAIAVIARTSIELEDDGTINAGGAGGAGGMISDGGGGGGGSGGMIIVDAPTITSSGVLAANGGGGGEGADNNENGEPGEPGRPSSTRARGGDSDAGGGATAGDGGAGSNPNGSAANAAQSGGGGGGGGGVGFVVARGDVNIGGTISPPPIEQ